MPRILLKLAFAGLSFYAASSSIAASPYPATEHFGVPFSKDESWYRQCMRVEHRSAPGLPAGQTAAPHCDASALYYQKRSQAVTSAAEWNAVKECAIAHQDNTVLMMLYANGFGVPRDTDIAIHYACSIDFAAKAEMEARVAHLAGEPPSGKVFDQCDDITSGRMGAVCADIQESLALQVRSARLDRAVRALPASAQAAFKLLRAAAQAYARAAMSEVDAQGTGAPGFAIEHEGKLREQFMQAVLDTLGNKLAPASPADTTRLDQELNTVYQKLMSAPSSQQDWPRRIGDSTIDRSDVRNVERRWLAYRDAFIAFQAASSAQSSRDALTALLTGQRVAQLNAVARYL